MEQNDISMAEVQRISAIMAAAQRLMAQAQQQLTKACHLIAETHRHLVQAQQRIQAQQRMVRLFHAFEGLQVGIVGITDYLEVSQDSQRRVEEAQRLVAASAELQKHMTEELRDFPESPQAMLEAQTSILESQRQMVLSQQRMSQLQEEYLLTVTQLDEEATQLGQQQDQLLLLHGIEFSVNDHYLGASQEVISRLPVYTLKPADLPRQTDKTEKENSLNDAATKKQKKTGDCTSTQCLICMEDYQVGEKRMVLPTCHHGFHSQCAVRWLTTNASCPLCKERLPADC